MPSKSQRNYSATKRELFAIVSFTQHFRYYLLGQKFLIVTNHRALTCLYSFKKPGRNIAQMDRKTRTVLFEI